MVEDLVRDKERERVRRPWGQAIFTEKRAMSAYFGAGDHGMHVGDLRRLNCNC